MIAIITALFTSGALKWVGIGVAGLVTLVLTWFHGKSTGTAQAADQVKAAQTQIQVEQMNAAAANADKEQAQAETVAAKVAAKALADTVQMPESQIDAEAAKLGMLPKE